MDDRLLRTVNYITALFAANADGHDAAHSLRVYRNACVIADACPGCDRTVVALAALLHDADDHKLFHTENNANARAFLTREGVDADTIERVCAVINGVSFSQNRGRRPETLEGQIVQDADRLDALGAVGVARTFAFGGSHGRPLEDSIEHFHEKLLLLRDEMNTPAGRAMADERHAFLERFLEQWNRETNEGEP
ncbi:MAG: HD domain-containing protein [Oscillospiraceae bacterium]|nr:HD domain-containing protein [Oscillospiraceae bacterium]